MVPEEVGEEGCSLSLLARAGGEVCMAQPLTLRRGEVGKESLGGERSARTHRLSCSNQGAGGRESSYTYLVLRTHTQPGSVLSPPPAGGKRRDEIQSRVLTTIWNGSSAIPCDS